MIDQRVIRATADAWDRHEQRVRIARQVAAAREAANAEVGRC